MSCERDIAEQFASIRSFFRYVGVPRKWNVVSDGSHDSKSKALLEAIHPNIRVVNLSDIMPRDVHPQVQRMMSGREPHVGKKLALEVYLPINGPTIYTDSDVLFLPGGSDLARLLEKPHESPLFLPDVYPALDSRIVGPLSQVEMPVNAGFFILFSRPDWLSLLNKLSSIPDPGFLQEQSLVHLMMHNEGGRPLDSSQYLLAIEDWNSYRHKAIGSDAVLRHYVSTVRHKMWCRIGRSFMLGTTA